MIHSMTAFARYQSTLEDGTSLTWEIRAVNQRYLEPSFRMPEQVRELEFALREQMRKHLHRGKVEASLKIQSPQDSQIQPEINQPALAQLAAQLNQIQAALKFPLQADPLALLQWPGIVSQQAIAPEVLFTQVQAGFVQALQALQAARAREGQALADLIEQRLAQMQAIVSELQTQVPLWVKAQADLLMQRLAAAKVELDPQRLEAEIVLQAQKADVAEELDRLQTHIQEVQRIMRQKQAGPVGRRLDFLVQELNREANTLAAKAVVIESTQKAVDLKVLIEQIREQVQNIE
ncbi:TIGR00255 family protein [Allopseudospirillum japonicum]|uniref:TIGR00255 family protein n=1 Tax=Allopseudospirillum japonicum TaxID=64971 RepID=A0A1H6UUF5_9GAMM|nr:YicC/YloC family endoribonuclease [Allopseudospirillum japonicum]SEI91950.1 TIGR00255 family protein [Allopseudospirillum japonicum]